MVHTAAMHAGGLQSRHWNMPRPFSMGTMAPQRQAGSTIPIQVAGEAAITLPTVIRVGVRALSDAAASGERHRTPTAVGQSRN
jgi:hypothetical protein